MSSNEDWMKTEGTGFGTFTDKDDFLHPEHTVPGDSLTETQYFGFNIPQEDIYGFTYLWVHPNLKVITGGLWVVQGKKRHHLQAELFDVHAYLSQETYLTNDLHSFRLPNSYGVEVLEPGKKMHISYNDEKLGNSLDMTATAIMPVAMRTNNLHFEQSMCNEGELMLRGKRYNIDNTFCVRDRSWGQLRPEEHNPIPPNTWMTGTFNKNFVFNVNAFDHPDLDPVWKGAIDWSAERTLADGWIYLDGELMKLEQARKDTKRDPITGVVLSHNMDVLTECGREFTIKGTTTAGLPWSGWPNMVCQLYLTRWECEGLTGWGDTQECQWTNFVRDFTSV